MVLDILCEMLECERGDLRAFVTGAEPIDVAEALYVYCSLNHSGQWSAEYRALSRLQVDAGFSPGLSCTESGLEGDAAEILEMLQGEGVTA